MFLTMAIKFGVGLRLAWGQNF